MSAADQRGSGRHQLFLVRRAARSAAFLRRIPGADLQTLFPGIERLSVTLAHRARPRGLPHGDAFVLALICAYLRPRRIFEIGTGTGEGTLIMASNAADGARVETLDLGDAPSSLGVQSGDHPLEAGAVGEAFAGTSVAGAITQHLGDSAAFDFTPFRGTMDLVFVDGAHTADYVRGDSQAALSMLAPGGTIVWDDCHLYHPGVSQGLTSLLAAGHPVRRLETTRFAILRTSGGSR
ncbi:MAG: class I SAM-dependent methyltransferase [Solirubrobacteraceae bacterium]|nr:class I SAM-dependent methyltransferase [Solirubrobacteraceae bacterium]